MGTNKLLLFALLPICAWAVPNANDGKLLYEESCAKCHGISSYQGLGMDEITNLIELAHWTDTCSKHFRLDWNNQDIEDTVHYLNREFFRLDR